MDIDTQTYTYKTAGDCAVRADVMRLGGCGEGLAPVIVWIHGGALMMGSRVGAAQGRMAQMLLGAGYALVSIDYRLAPETKLPEIIDDLRDALAWVRREARGLFGGDPDRLAVVGGSAGGYLTLMSGFCVLPRPRALVSFYGYGDLVGEWYSRPDPFYCREPAVPEAEARAAVGGHEISGVVSEESERGQFYLYCRQQGVWPREVAGFDPDEEPEAFIPFCPLQNVTAHYPPTLLLHGDADTDVPHQQSVLMAEALAREGVEHELITITGGQHGFDGEEPPSPQVASALDRVMSFLSGHMR